jgi:mRNA interferase RelE/StbE
MPYRVEYSNIVIKEHIPKLSTTAKKQIQKAIEAKLTQSPLIFGKPMQYSYKGHRRLRVSDYRVIYRIEEEQKTVYVVAIGHRKDVYDE